MLNFIKIGDSKTGKTSVFKIINNGDIDLGYIRWYTPWRRYIFYPNMGTIWDARCLTEIIEFVSKLMEERKKNADIRS